MNLYEKNLEFFRSYLGLEYKTVTLEESWYKSNIENIGESSNIIVENDNKRCFLHSIYDITREVENMFKNVKPDVERLIVFGLGCGHCLEYIKNNFKDLRNVVIIEPDLNVFKACMEKLDFYEAINNIGNVTFIINKTVDETISILFDENINRFMEKTELIHNFSYRILYDKYYEMLINKIIEYTRIIMVNLATNERHFYNWSENVMNNIKHNATLLEKFYANFEGVPAIIASAGPSLNYSINYLKQLKSKAIIIAVGSAIKILDSNGVIPHFRMAIDGSDGERKVFEKIHTANVPLIFSDDLNYNILDDYNGEKIRTALDTTPICSYFKKKLYDSDTVVHSGFSVANVAVDVAKKLGCKKVIFIGQDLCYADGSLYAKGSWNDNENLEEDFSNSKYIKVKNVIGESVYTTKAFLGMKSIFEFLIKINPQIKFINATKKGLNIEGAENKGFLQVVGEDLNKEFNVEKIINDILKENNNNSFELEKKLNELKLNLTNGLKEIEKLNNYRLKKVKKLGKYFKSDLGMNRLRSELEYIEEIENDLEKIELYKEAIKPMIFDKFKVIYMNYCCDGKDEVEFIENSIKALTAQTIELSKYTNFLLGLV